MKTRWIGFLALASGLVALLGISLLSYGVGLERLYIETPSYRNELGEFNSSVYQEVGLWFLSVSVLVALLAITLAAIKSLLGQLAKTLRG